VTDKVMTGLALNERQMKAVIYVKAHGLITNKAYRDLTGVIIRTASRDLENLVSKGVLRKIGKTGRSAHYVLARKQDVIRTNRTFASREKNRPQRCCVIEQRETAKWELGSGQANYLELFKNNRKSTLIFPLYRLF